MFSHHEEVVVYLFCCLVDPNPRAAAELKDALHAASGVAPLGQRLRGGGTSAPARARRDRRPKQLHLAGGEGGVLIS